MKFAFPRAITVESLGDLANRGRKFRLQQIVRSMAESLSL